jgi:hypothetical protein
LRHDITSSTIQILLSDMEDEDRGMILVERAASAAAIATRVFHRMPRYFLSRRNSEEPTAEVLARIADAIQNVPERVLADFAQDASLPRASATAFIASAIYRVLMNDFNRTPFAP